MDTASINLEELVAKMRALGIKEYRTENVHIVLDAAPISAIDERTEEEQQRLRDQREKEFLENKMRILKRAAWGIGPPPGKVR